MIVNVSQKDFMRPVCHGGKSDFAAPFADVPVCAAHIPINDAVPHDQDIQMFIQEHPGERPALADQVPALPKLPLGKDKLLNFSAEIQELCT